MSDQKRDLPGESLEQENKSFNFVFIAYLILVGVVLVAFLVWLGSIFL